MKASPAEVIRQMLLTSALVTAPAAKADWPCYVSNMPDGDGVKNEAVAVYDTNPLVDGREMRTGEVIEHFGVQVKVRSTEYRIGWNKITAIADRCASVIRTNVIVDDFTFTLQNVTTGRVLPNGVEEGTKRRNIFTLNCTVTMSAVQN